MPNSTPLYIPVNHAFTGIIALICAVHCILAWLRLACLWCFWNIATKISEPEKNLNFIALATIYQYIALAIKYQTNFSEPLFSIILTNWSSYCTSTRPIFMDIQYNFLVIVIFTIIIFHNVMLNYFKINATLIFFFHITHIHLYIFNVGWKSIFWSCCIFYDTIYLFLVVFCVCLLLYFFLCWPTILA